MGTVKWLVRGIGAGALVALSACGQADRAEPAAPQAEAAKQAMEDQYKTWGRGYDRLTDSAALTCVTPGEVVPASGWVGKQMTYGLEIVESSQKLHEKLEVAAAADVKFGLGKSVDAKVSFSKSVDMSSTAVYVMANVVVENAPTSIPYARLTEEARNELERNPTRFRELCGDSFLAGMRNGAEYRAVIQIQTNTQEEKNTLAASLNVKLPIVKASGDFERVLMEELSGRQIRAWAYQRGGSGSTEMPVCTSVECMLAQAKAIPDIATNSPIPFGHSYLPYTTLPLPPVSPLRIQEQEWVQSQLMRERLVSEDMLEVYQLAQARPPDYEPMDPSVVEARIDELRARISTLWQASTACYFDIQQCRIPSLSPLPSAPRWIVPRAPTSLTATPGAAAVVLRWMDNSANETGFEVYRKLSSSGTWTRIATVAAALAEFTDATPLSEVAHDYYVRAMNGGSPSSNSNIATATPAPVALRTFGLAQSLLYGRGASEVQGSATTFTLAGDANLYASFDFWYYYPTSYSYMAVDLRFILDGREVARQRFPYASTLFQAPLGRVSAGTHTLVVDAQTVLLQGPPTTTYLYGASRRGCYSSTCPSSDSTIKVAVTQ